MLQTDDPREFCSKTFMRRCRELNWYTRHRTSPRVIPLVKECTEQRNQSSHHFARGIHPSGLNILKTCQRILSGAALETMEEQPHFFMFNRRAPRRMGAELPKIDQESNVEVALEMVRRTNQERANRWRNRAKIRRKTQKVEVHQLVWIKHDYTTLE